MHGGTQTVRFWGLQHVHWGCEGSCCCFLRLQSRLVWDVPKALQGRQGMCGSLAGWFQVAIQAVDWFVPEHHLCIGFRCRFCGEVLSAFDHGGTQTVRFWGLQYVHWGCEGSCCCFLRLQSRLVWDVPKALQGRQGMCGSLAGWFQVAIQAVDFVPEHHLCIGLRCRFCEVLSAFDAWWHANSPLLLSTGGVKAHVAASCGCKAGWFEMFPRLCKVDRGCAAAWQVGFRWLSRPCAADWFVPEHHLCIGLRCRFCEVLSAFDAWWHANSPLLGATICPLGVWRLMLLLLAAAKQVGLRCSQGFARSTGDVRQPGRLVSGGYPGRRLVCSRASSMYWFKVSFLRWGVVGFWSWWHANSPLLGATICPLGVWRLMLLLLAAAKQVGLRCSQGFARSTGDVRQPGRLVSGGSPGRRLVCSRASSMYWFKVSFLWGVVGFWCMVARKQSAFGGYNMSTGGVKAHVAASCGCKAGWFEMFPRLCKVDRGCAAAWQVGFRWLSRP